MSQREASFRKVLIFCKNALCLCLILLLVYWMAAPFFQLYKPSSEQMLFLHSLCPKDAEVLSAWRKRLFPFPGCNRIKAKIVLHADLTLNQWCSDTLEKIDASEIKVDGDSVSALAQTRKGRKVSLQAKIRKRIITIMIDFG